MKIIFRENKTKFIWGLVIVAILVAAAAGYGLAGHFKQVAAESEAAKVIEMADEDPGNADMEKLTNLLDNSFLTDETVGDIYRALAVSSYDNKNKLKYNNYIGYAGYYYEKAGCDEKLTVLYSEYIGRLYENAGYREALELLKGLAKKVDIDELSDQSVAASYYLSYADVAQMLGKRDTTMKMLKNAKVAIARCSNGKYLLLKESKYDMLLTRQTLLDGDKSKAKEILSEYSIHDTFGLNKNNLYLKCDFLIPYCELRAKLLVEEGSVDKAYKYVDKYVELCHEFNFHVMEQRLIRYFVAHTGVDSDDKLGSYEKLERDLSQKTIDYFSGQYCASLLGNVNEVQKELKAEDRHASKQKLMVILVYIALYLAVIIWLLIECVFVFFNTDGLTGIGNRKLYDRRRRHLEGFKKEHHLLILDIDDFKAVNDTYSHAAGDKVLKALAKILETTGDRNSYIYRYGGEEFCVITTHGDTDKAFENAEAIRASMEAHDWGEELNLGKSVRITISGGLAKSTDGTFPFHEADKALYAAKSSGKNKIVFGE